MKKFFHYLLFILFLLTILVPLTGIKIHKLASTLFLILSLIHTMIEYKKLDFKKVFLMLIIIISFITGIVGMILDHIPFILQFHKVLSIFLVFFLGIHIFVYHKKMRI